MAQLTMNTFVELLMAVFLIAVVVLIVLTATGKIFPEIRARFVNDQSKKEQISNNFDVLLRNLEDCSKLTKDGCVCEGFVAWPSFQKESVLEMETRGAVTTFILKYEKKELRNEKLENLKLNAKLIKKGQTPDSYIMEDLASDPRMIMDWKTNPPTFSLAGDPGPNLIQGVWQGVFGKNERKVVSSFIYHDKGKMYFLTSFEPADKVSAFIGSMMKCTA